MLPLFSRLHGVLNDHIKLSDYGRGVEGIAFIFVVQQPDDTFHEEKLTYNEQEKELVAQYKIDPALLTDLSEEEVLQLMAQTYLSKIEEFERLDISEFDALGFEEDVRRLFEGERWLLTEKAY